MKRLLGTRGGMYYAFSVRPPQLKARRHRQQCTAMPNEKGWELLPTLNAGYSTLSY